MEANIEGYLCRYESARGNEMKTFTKQEIKKILANHVLWLNDKGGERANLSYADLSSANLRYANLSSANLSYADLRSAERRSAELRSA